MSDEARRRLADRLREARESKGLLQEDVASYLGVPRPAISQMENGNRKVDAIELARLAKLYGQSLSYFSDGDETVNESSGIELLKRTASELSQKDRAEVLRFAEFLKQKSQTGRKRK